MPNKKTKRRPGRATLGLYPEVSRTALAQATGYDISTVSGILRGRTKAKLRTALVLARMCGVTLEELDRDLERERRRFAARQKRAGGVGQGTGQGAGGTGEGEYLETA